MVSPSWPPALEPLIRAAGVHDPEHVVFKLIHKTLMAHVAWHPCYGWTQYRRGHVFTFDEACTMQDALEDGDGPKGVASQSGTVLDGKLCTWFAHGRRIYLAR